MSPRPRPSETHKHSDTCQVTLDLITDSIHTCTKHSIIINWGSTNGYEAGKCSFYHLDGAHGKYLHSDGV